MADSLRSKQQIIQDPVEKQKLAEKIDEIDQRVYKMQDDYVSKYPQSFTAKLIQTSKEQFIPKYGQNDDMETKLRQYNKYKDHYLDNMDFSDERLFRSPVYFQKIDNYIHTIIEILISSFVGRVIEVIIYVPDSFFCLYHFRGKSP